jgi:nitroreductase
MADSAWTSSSSGAPGAAIVACIRAAVAAPSIHNSQPWLFRARRDAIDVLVDRRRQLPVADPDGREMHVSVGAALCNLRIAMLAEGRQPRLRLFPEPDHPDLVATVTIGPATAASTDTHALAEAISRRRTNRRPFGSTPIPEPVLDAVVAAAHDEGGALVVVDPVTRSAVLSLARSAEKQLRSDARYRAELTEWTSPDPHRGDGVPAAAFGPRPELAALPLRDFDLAHTTDRRVARFESDPTIAVLYTFGDTSQDWLQAGQALQRVLLTATVHGLATTLLTQVIEVPQLRHLFGTPDEPRVVQSILRLGYAGDSPRTPRRPLADVLIHDQR